MQVAEPCLERRPRNPVVYASHSRTAGMTTRRATSQRASRRNLPSTHSSGMTSWIPACAGMTTGGVIILFRHSGESRNPGGEAGVVKGWQGLADGALGCYACVLSFPPCGNGLFKALDSSFRWAATGILPSHRIQNFLSINDGGGFRLSPDGYRPPRRLVPDAALSPTSL